MTGAIVEDIRYGAFVAHFQMWKHDDPTIIVTGPAMEAGLFIGSRRFTTESLRQLDFGFALRPGLHAHDRSDLACLLRLVLERCNEIRDEIEREPLLR